MKKPKHAKFSASGSYRWLKCPGSIALSEKVPAPPSSPYAEEGTLAHECLEELLNVEFNPEEAVTTSGNHSREMIEHARTAIGEIENRISKGAEILFETKVDLSFVYPDMFGTVDAAIIEHFGRLTVIDYKYGAGIAVDAKDNSQLIYYALGLAQKYYFNFAEVAIVIIQPRAEHSEGPVREHVMTVDELLEWEEIFKAGVDRALNPNALTIPGDWCRFCPASVICPAISSKALAEAKIDFAPEVESLTLPPTMWTGNELSFILSSIEKIETWIEAVKAHAFITLNRGEKIPGWKLVAKRSTRKWLDELETDLEAYPKWGNKVYTTPELLSPAQLEKVTGDKKWVEERVTNVSSGVTLAPESDRRPAVNSALEGFEKVSEVEKQNK